MTETPPTRGAGQGAELTRAALESVVRCVVGGVEHVHRGVRVHSSASHRQLECAYGRVCSPCLCDVHVCLCPGIQVRMYLCHTHYLWLSLGQGL